MATVQEIINATREFVPSRDIVRIKGVAMGVASVEYVDYSEDVARRARSSALAKMNEQAKQMGADAVVGIRFDSVVAMPSHYTGVQTVEYTAYGTAVVTISQY